MTRRAAIDPSSVVCHSAGNIKSKTDALQRVTEYSYNRRHMLTEEMDPLRGENRLAYDGNGNLERITLSMTI